VNIILGFLRKVRSTKKFGSEYVKMLKRHTDREKRYITWICLKHNMDNMGSG
jgi:hypothetical protein